MSTYNIIIFIRLLTKHYNQCATLLTILPLSPVIRFLKQLTLMSEQYEQSKISKNVTQKSDFLIHTTLSISTQKFQTMYQLKTKTYHCINNVSLCEKKGTISLDINSVSAVMISQPLSCYYWPASKDWSNSSLHHAVLQIWISRQWQALYCNLTSMALILIQRDQLSWGLSCFWMLSWYLAKGFF